jgi:hypothetical protein
MAAEPAEPAGSPIEALFTPSTRSGESLPYGFMEVELLPGLTVENVLARGVTWEDFYLFVCDKYVWIAPPGVYVHSQYLYGEGALNDVLTLGGDEDNKLCVRVRSGTAATGTTATCDFLVRLLATCEHHGVSIRGRRSNTVPSPLSGAALSLFLQESPSCLRQVTLYYMALSADQCRALATMSRLDVELKIIECGLVYDAAGAFVECLQSNRGPVDLYKCNIDSQILASALSGNSRVTKLKTHYPSTNDAGTAVWFRNLANNKGLVDLDLFSWSISNDNWSVLCESLKTHPTLTKLDLHCTLPMSHTAGVRIVLTDNDKAHRTRLLAEMMQENAILHTIALPEDERDEQIYTESILPYLETNRYRPRVLAIKKADFALRRPLLGRALQTEPVRNDSNLRWMFLSGNPDVVVQANEDSEQVVEVAVNAPVPEVAAIAQEDLAASAQSEGYATRSTKRKR